MQDDKTVLLFGASGGAFDLLDEKRQVRLRVDTLRENMTEFLNSLSDIIPAEEKKEEGLKLKTVTVAVGISAKGQVGFLGTGVEASGTATLTLTFDVA